jgi:hypothetical protein
MIRIVTQSGVNLDLGELSLRYEAVNTLFEEDAFQGDYSFPFTLPYSDVNMRSLQFIHKPAVFKTSVEQNVTVFLGTRSYSSKLIVNGTSKKGYNASIAGGLKGLTNGNKSLKELNYNNGSTIDLATDFSNIPNYAGVNWNNIIAFPPHYNPEFYNGLNSDFQGVINRVESDSGDILINDIIVGNKYCLVPFMYRHYILKTIFEEQGLALRGNYWTDNEAATALQYNNYALDKREEQGCIVKGFGTQLLTGFVVGDTYSIILNDTLPGCADEQNNFNNTTYQYNVPANGDYAVRLDASIDITLSFPYPITYFAFEIWYDGAVIEADVSHCSGPGVHTLNFTVLDTKPSAVLNKKIEIKIGASCDDPMDATLFYATAIVKSATMTITRYDLPEFNVMNPIITLSNHVPDVTVEDYLKLVKNTAQLMFDFDWDNKTVSINYAEKVLAGAPEIDLTDISDPYPEQVFDERQKGFTLEYDFGSSDELIATNIKEFDESKIVGEFPTENDLPTPAFTDDLAVVLNSNKVFITAFLGGSYSWEYHCDYYKKVTLGKGGIERKIELAPMLMTTAAENESATADADHKKCLMPTIHEIGASELFDLGINEPSMRTVFYRGLNQDPSVGGNYLYASSTNIDINGNEVGSYNLTLQGVTGYYNRFLEKILTAIDNSEVFEFLIMLPVSYLQYKGKVQIKNVNFIVKNISMFLGKSVKQSVVKLLKL